MTSEDYEKIIEELEAEWAKYKHVSSAVDNQWALSQDEIADLKAELVKAKEAIECVKLYVDHIAANAIKELTGGNDE